RSLWMLTTASLTRRTTSTTGVCRRFQLRKLERAGGANDVFGAAIAVVRTGAALGVSATARSSPNKYQEPSTKYQKKMLLYFFVLGTWYLLLAGVRGGCMLMSPLDFALGAISRSMADSGCFDREPDKAANGLARFTISPACGGR